MWRGVESGKRNEGKGRGAGIFLGGGKGSVASVTLKSRIWEGEWECAGLWGGRMKEEGECVKGDTEEPFVGLYFQESFEGRLSRRKFIKKTPSCGESTFTELGAMTIIS